MASESSLMYVTGSKTFVITEYSKAKGVGNKNYIQSECFTVGGYDWAIKYYPQGDIESASDHVSLYVNVLNATKEVRAIYSFRLWDWINKKWSTDPQASSSPVTFLPSGVFGDGWGYRNYYKRSDLESSNYLSNNTVKINCTLFVIPPPTPAPASKPDGNEENPKWSKKSSKYGFHIPGYAPPNAPSDMYPDLPRQPTVRIYCEANKDFSMTARNHNVVLAPTDPSDHYQHWIKDMTYGGTHANGYPSFALVNRVTGEALKNPDGEDQPVSLIPYKNRFKDLVNWTEVGSTGFRAIRITNNPSLNMTAVTNEPGQFNDGTKIIIQQWRDTPEQHWNIVPNVPQKLISNL